MFLHTQDFPSDNPYSFPNRSKCVKATEIKKSVTFNEKESESVG